VARISSKHQITLPVAVLERLGLKAGDELTVEDEAPDRIVLTRRPTNPRSAIGVFDGLYPAGHLDEMRKDWA